MMPGQFGPIEPRPLAFHEGQRLQHVHRRNAFGDADGQRNPGVGRFHDRVGGKRRRHEDHRRVRAGLAHRVVHAVEDRPAFVRRAALAGRHAADDLRAVRRGRLGVKRAFAAGQPLHDQPRVFVEQNGHVSASLASATTFSAASPIESAVVKFRPLSRSIRLPSSTLVPSMRITIGTRHAELRDGGNDALRQHVAAQDAAEDVDQHGLDVLVGHQDAERVLDLLGVGAAADVEEVGRLAARQLDDVHRRHRQAGAVDHAADVAVEPDVVQRELRGLDLERILFGDVAQLAEIGVAIERVVVEADLGVERQQIAALGQDQRVDLDHRGVGLDERLVDGVEQLHQLVRPRPPLSPMPNASLRAWNGTMPVPGSMCSRRIFSGSLAATSSMSMPPAALAMMTGRRGRAVDQDAQIELALDLEPFLDEHAADLLALGAGLMRDQRHADHLLRELLGFVGRLGDLDAAALAAAAGVDLRLDDGDVAAEPLGGVDRFGRRERHLAARHGNAEAREH